MDDVEEMQQLVEGDALFEASQNLLFHRRIEAVHVERLQVAGILTYNGLKTHIANNPHGILGLANPTLNIIRAEAETIVALRRAEANLQRTITNIGKRDQRHSYNRTKKRLEVLEVAIRLGARRPAQIDHWEREKKACEKRLKNMRENN